MDLEAKVGAHDAVICIGDVHGQFEALSAIVAATEKKFRQPFYVFLGDLVDGPRTVDALGLVFDLMAAGRAVTLLGNHEHFLLCDIRAGQYASEERRSCVEKIGADRFIQFLTSLPKYLQFQNFFISHAPVYASPQPGWIESEKPEDFNLQSFEQAASAGYDFAGVKAHGTFASEDLVQEAGRIGICGHEQLEEIVFHPNQYICLDSGIAVGRSLSCLDLLTGFSASFDQTGSMVASTYLNLR